MPLFETPTKDEITQMQRTFSKRLRDLLKDADEYKEQMDRLTNAELVTIGFSDTGSPSEVDWIRSHNTALQYLAKYYRNEDVSAYTDNPSYALEHFLTIREF